MTIKKYNNSMDTTKLKQSEMFDNLQLDSKGNNKLIKQKLVSYYNEGTHIKVVTTSRTFHNISGHDGSPLDTETTEILPTNLKKVEDIK